MKKNLTFAATIMIACAVSILTGIGPQINTATAADKAYRMKIQSLFPRGDLSMEKLTVFGPWWLFQHRTFLKYQMSVIPKSVLLLPLNR